MVSLAAYDLPITLVKLSHCIASVGGDKKLDSYVLVAVLGFQSLDGFVADSQFTYNPDEMKPNYVKGSREEIDAYIMEHFCSPCGTILDVSNDARGKIVTMYTLYS